MKVFDVFLFFNELDLLEIRLNMLYPFIDYFVINEATQTFFGSDKPLYYLENKERFRKFEDKIIHNIIEPPTVEQLDSMGEKYGTLVRFIRWMHIKKTVSHKNYQTNVLQMM